MSEEQTVERLRTLGLNLYESRAYLALLNANELTAKGVGQSALIPQSRTYDVLESLTRKGFAQSVPASPPAYVAVPARQVLESYYETKRKEIQGRAAKVQEEAQSKLEVIRDAYLTLTRDLPTRSDNAKVARDRIWVLQERENIESTLVGLIREARSEVLRITKPPEPGSRQPVDPFYIVGMENLKFVYEALERKVKMRWLSLEREIPTFLGLTINEFPERRYLDREEEITEKFLLVDNTSVLLNLHDPLSAAYGYVALAMQSKAVSSIFLDHFEKLWEKARPLGDVLPAMKKLVEDTREALEEAGLGRREAATYEMLARSGAISQDTLAKLMTRRRIQPQDTFASCERLVRLGLIHRENSLKVLLVEHPSKVKIALASGKLRIGQGARVTTRRMASGKNP